MTRSHPKSVSSLLCALALALTFAVSAQAQQNLNISKSFVPATIAPGSTSVLTFTIGTQDDTYTYSKIGFTDDLPPGVTLTDPVVIAKNSCYFTVTASNGGQTITAADGTLSQYVSSCVLAIAITSAAPDTYTNTTSTLTWSSDGVNIFPVPSPAASAKLTVDSSLPTFSKSFSPKVISGGASSALTFTIDNSGTGSAANNLAFTDTLPTNLIVATPANASSTCGGTFDPQPNDTSLTFTGGSVAAGDTCTVKVDVTAPFFGLFPNVSGDLTSSLGDSGVASDLLTVSLFGLSKKFLPSSGQPGGSATLKFTVANSNPAIAITDAGFTDDLGAFLPGTVATSLPADGFCGTNSTITGSSLLTISHIALAAASSCTFDVTVQIPSGAAPGTYTNTTSAISGIIASQVLSPPGAPASATLTVVAPPVTAIPTLNVWALVALAGLLFLSAGWFLKR